MARIEIKQLGIQKFVPVNKRSPEKGVSTAKQRVLPVSLTYEEWEQVTLHIISNVGSKQRDLEALGNHSALGDLKQEIKDAEKLYRKIMKTYIQEDMYGR